MSPPDEQLARIAAKVEAAAEVPANMTIFGARKHRFVLNAPLPNDTVAEFERAHGIRLPDPYRRFVTSLADGGAGPSYGLLRLAGTHPRHLAAPSPFEPGVTYRDDWWEELTDSDRDPSQGTLTVVDHGCTSCTLLIVSGPARGRLVSVDFIGAPAPYVLEDPDFLSWYERWLDELAAGYDVTQFCNKLPGGEAELIVIATTDPDHERRSRATWSLCALPSLTPAGRLTVTGLVTDPVAPVRDMALRMVRNFGVAEAEGPARAALHDDDPTVRAAAMSALRALEIPDLAAVARAALGDPAVDVMQRAVWALRDTGEMAVADLVPLARSADPRVRVTAIHYLRDAAGGGIDALLTSALEDDVADVRRTAIQTIGSRGLDQFRPRLATLLKTETDPTVLTNLRRTVPKPPSR